MRRDFIFITVSVQSNAYPDQNHSTVHQPKHFLTLASVKATLHELRELFTVAEQPCQKAGKGKSTGAEC